MTGPLPVMPQASLDALVRVVIQETGPHRQLAALVAAARHLGVCG